MSRLVMTVACGLVASISFVVWDVRTDAEMIREARLAGPAALPPGSDACPSVLSHGQAEPAAALSIRPGCAPQSF